MSENKPIDPRAFFAESKRIQELLDCTREPADMIVATKFWNGEVDEQRGARVWFLLSQSWLETRRLYERRLMGLAATTRRNACGGITNRDAGRTIRQRGETLMWIKAIAFSLLALAGMFATSMPADARGTCTTSYRALSSHDGWRRYRVVNGQRCWYVGGHAHNRTARAKDRPHRAAQVHQPKAKQTHPEPPLSQLEAIWGVRSEDRPRGEAQRSAGSFPRQNNAAPVAPIPQGLPPSLCPLASGQVCAGLPDIGPSSSRESESSGSSQFGDGGQRITTQKPESRGSHIQDHQSQNQLRHVVLPCFDNANIRQVVAYVKPSHMKDCRPWYDKTSHLDSDRIADAFCALASDRVMDAFCILRGSGP